LLQAGPLLVREGRSAIAEVEDREGFSATAEEFDQDLTADRDLRLAIALTPERFLAVAALSALNLDGGSAGVVVIVDGQRVNTPRDDEGEDMGTASPSVTAIVLEPAV